MNNRSNIRLRGLLGAAAALAAIAVAVPAISAADRHGGDDHHATVGTIESFDADTGTLVITPTSGDDVSGMVNDRTKINCEREDADDDNGDDGPNHDNGDDHGDDGPGPRRQRRSRRRPSLRQARPQRPARQLLARRPHGRERGLRGRSRDRPERPRLRGGRAALSGRDAALGIPRSSPPGEPAGALARSTWCDEGVDDEDLEPAAPSASGSPCAVR